MITINNRLLSVVLALAILICIVISATLGPCSVNVSIVTKAAEQTTVQQYQYDEVDKVVSKIKQLQSDTTDSIVFGVITDSHVGFVNNSFESKSKRAINSANFAIDNVASRVNADFIANLGDNNYENNIDTDNAYNAAVYLKDCISETFGNHTSFRLVGNHDQSNSCPDTVYELNGKYNIFDNYGSDIKRGYGYKDFADKKLRVICLNTSDYYHTTGGYDMSYGQKQWFMSALDMSDKSDFADWSIVILSHFPLDYENHSDYNTFYDVKSILDAYTSGSDISITVNPMYAKAENENISGTLSYDYSNKNCAKIIADFHGHMHNDSIGRMHDNRIVRVSSNNTCGGPLEKGAQVEGSVTYSVTGLYQKTPDTAEETSVTFYVIDKKRGIIHSVQYGAGVDRDVTYLDKQNFVVTNLLSNATTDNQSDTVYDGASYSAVIKADDFCDFSEYSVFMGGCDVTSSCTTVNNDTLIISVPSVNNDITAKVSAVIKQYLLGDADGSGYVTILDATVIQRYLALFELPIFIEKAADTDKDGKITIIDATIIQRYLAKLIDKLG